MRSVYTWVPLCVVITVVTHAQQQQQTQQTQQPVFRTTTRLIVQTVTVKDNGFFSMIFSRKGDVMLTGMMDGLVLFWNMKALGLPK